eukprot:CAMPEP_0168852416 /NCGR_PEP_ID=MMETSP0727-20121128/12963_1 /TAXON_ID=265536 /ORGANISM="Amphiprora sp., Strain CCMP467" /LENGTH=185 /DNA_ID=CAMNT_0008906533 /DNA_START=52 /DNA_END=610 /DNA_ORIENTATION=+
MVHSLDYTTISHVLDSWERARRLTTNFEQEVGVILFQQYVTAACPNRAAKFPLSHYTFAPCAFCHRLFKNDPQCKVLFGFPLDIDTDSAELLQSKRFLMHAAYLVEMLDTSLGMLGPDDELLAEIMYDLGSKHTRYGVKADMFPQMGKALMVALEAILKHTLNDATRDAWKKTFAELSSEMIRGM